MRLALDLLRSRGLWEMARWNESVERSFRSFLGSLSENMSFCTLFVFELDSRGILWGVSRAHTVPGDVRLNNRGIQSRSDCSC